MVRLDSTGGCFVCECMEPLCVYIVVHAHRANSCARANGHGIPVMGMGRWEWMRVITRAFVCRRRARRRTDSRDAPRVTIDIVRIERLSLSRASRTTNSFTHSFTSFIHSFRCERTNEGTKGRTNEGTRSTDARETRDLARDATIDGRVRSHPSNSARRDDERYARLSRTHETTHRTHRIARIRV